MAKKHMTPKQKSKRGEIIKGMKKGNGKKFEKRYPGRGDEVMQATATKRAMNEDNISFFKQIFMDSLNEENHKSPQDRSKITKQHLEGMDLSPKDLKSAMDLVDNLHGAPSVDQHNISIKLLDFLRSVGKGKHPNMGHFEELERNYEDIDPREKH